MKENEDFLQEEEMAEGPSEIQEAPEEAVSRLKSELEAKAKEAEENYNRYLRSVADLDNYRKRSEKEKQDAISFANECLISEILPVVDNFERALSHANGEENLESLRQGVKLTIDQMLAVLKKNGLQEIKSVGERFDPAIHHAITEEESGEPGTVVKEFQRGYTLKGRLLRPAMVAVSKAPAIH
ncbi:MAG: nucleotide exchange factor GrpE [Deltaproteobacteria bacterium]|nr:nucleotide exchange factor GrpE [Deltaproteobacteria bacterium]